jgi:archaellum biogenesis ATPase FlaH
VGRLSWGEKALRDECWGVHDADDREPEDALAAAAWRVAQVVAGGHLDMILAWSRLEHAAEAAGVPMGQARAIIGDAIDRAAEAPRHPDGPPQPRKPVRRRFSPVEWQGTSAPPREWIWPQWIPAATTTLLYGEGGTGKSLLALQLAAAIATGRPFLGHPMTRRPVMCLFCEEDEDELQRRQEAVNAALGIAMVDLEDLTLMPAVGEDNLLMTFDARGVGQTSDFGERLFGMAEEAEVGLLIVDTAADTFAGDENNRAQVRQFIARLNAFAVKTRAAVLLLAHPSVSGVASGRGQSGSTAWVNSARSHLYFEFAATNRPDTDAPVDPAERVLSRKKANYSRKGDSLEMIWRDGAFAPGPEGGERRASGVKRLTQPQQLCLDALSQALREHGFPAAVGVAAKGGKMVPASRWREACDALRLTDSEVGDSRRKAFNIARFVLKKNGLADWDDHGAWLSAGGVDR